MKIGLPAQSARRSAVTNGAQRGCAGVNRERSSPEGGQRSDLQPSLTRRLIVYMRRRRLPHVPAFRPDSGAVRLPENRSDSCKWSRQERFPSEAGIRSRGFRRLGTMIIR